MVKKKVEFVYDFCPVRTRSNTPNCRINIFKPGNVLIIKWVILELIGKGAMGEIYLAHQLNLKRDAAISKPLIVNEMMRMISDVR